MALAISMEYRNTRLECPAVGLSRKSMPRPALQVCGHSCARSDAKPHEVAGSVRDNLLEMVTIVFDFLFQSLHVQRASEAWLKRCLHPPVAA